MFKKTLKTLVPIALFLSLSISASAATWLPVADNTDFGSDSNISGPGWKSAAVFEGNLIIGLENTTDGCEVWEFNGTTWTQINTDGFGDTNNGATVAFHVYDGDLFVSTSNSVTGLEIWSYNGTVWTEATQQGTVPPGDGFGTSENINSGAMTTYNGQLYVGTYNPPSFGVTTGAELWKFDGADWTEENIGGLGFGDTDNQAISALLEDSDGHLLAGTTNGGAGAEIFEYDGSWSQRENLGISDSNNTNVDHFIDTGTSLYAFLRNATSGITVYESDYVTYDFTNIGDSGLGNSSNTIDLAATRFNNELYVGTFAIGNGTEIRKYTGSGTTWDLENSPGFGDITNWVTNSLIEYNGELYALSGFGQLIASSPVIYKMENPTVVPEFTTWLLVLTAAVGVGFIVLKRSKIKSPAQA